MKSIKWILYILMSLAVVACHDDDELKMKMVEMPVTIAIPAAGFSSPTDVGLDGQPAESRDTRAPGDPGTGEQFDLPQYIHVYLVATNSGSSSVTYNRFTVNKDEWKLITADDNTNDHFNYVTDKEGLYVYQGHLSMSMPAVREQGRVYIAAGDVNLEDYGLNRSITNAAQVPTLATVKADNNLSPHLKNLYSTPYNLKVDGKYYGTIEDFASQVPHLDIVLYHTATKVDVQWQVDEDCQGVKAWAGDADDMSAEEAGKVFFSRIEAYNLPETFPLFRPMDCTISYGTTNYSVALHADEPEQRAQRYNGRSVFYTIPRRHPDGNYYMGLRMRVNGYTNASPAKGHNAYIQIAGDPLTQEDGSPIYTPWLRAFVHVTDANVGNLVTVNEKSSIGI